MEYTEQAGTFSCQMKNSPAKIEISKMSDQELIRLVIKRTLQVLFVAFLCLFLPFLHFFLVPALFVLAPIVGAWQLFKDRKISSICGDCPNCQKSLEFGAHKISKKFHLICIYCKEKIKVEFDYQIEN